MSLTESVSESAFKSTFDSALNSDFANGLSFSILSSTWIPFSVALKPKLALLSAFWPKASTDTEAERSTDTSFLLGSSALPSGSVYFTGLSTFHDVIYN